MLWNSTDNVEKQRGDHNEKHRENPPHQRFTSQLNAIQCKPNAIHVRRADPCDPPLRPLRPLRALRPPPSLPRLLCRLLAWDRDHCWSRKSIMLCSLSTAVVRGLPVEGATSRKSSMLCSLSTAACAACSTAAVVGGAMIILSGR